jgi:hypothetical protein
MRVQPTACVFEERKLIRAFERATVHRRQTMSERAFWLPGGPDLPRMLAMIKA